MNDKKNKSPFGTYDIRGVYGENLTEDFAFKLGKSVAQYLGTEKVFVVGHDSRLSSPSLAAELTAGIESAGGKVFFLGLASTPRVYWQGAIKDFGGSIAVTASHLPAKHNGFKICREAAIPISSEDGLLELKGLVENETSVSSPVTMKHEQPFVAHGLEEYIHAMRTFLNASQELKIVIDIGGSPIGEEIIQLFNNENLKFELLDSTPDGNFSRRSPNPMDEGALDDLSAKVKEVGADFGAAFDGDGDRIVFVDEQGELIAPDLVAALLAKQVIKAQVGAKIMYDLRSSRALPEFIIAAGGDAVRSRVGHSFIKADMRKQNIVMAGELSSHYYWSDLSYTDNALRALIEMINLLCTESQTLSQLVSPLQTYANSGEVNFECADTNTVIEALKSKFASEKLDMTDGLTIDFPDWWFNVRASQTEPLLRLCVGATDGRLMQQKISQLKDFIAAQSR